ncbi:MAG: hypothetical protein LBV80_10895 [Deltaproteobacteria bacterium]|jgi:hypothetical protein|nr:hypothetical protein [Deltaproteobacteria bacterium]
MITLTIIKDVFSHQREVLKTDNLLECLYRRFPAWPKNARLFHEKIAFSREVTPRDAAGVERLAALDGDIYLLALPGGVASAVVAVVVAVLAVAAAMFLKPKIPAIAHRNTRNISPNNELSARVNKARPHERIPDIFGSVRSTPDLIVFPYSEYDANVEVEHAVMCIGRGQYEIHDMYDGETACDQIAGVSVQVYKPHARINSDQPYYRVGPAIEGEALLSIRSNSVNGQKLEPANKQNYSGKDNLIFRPSGRISLLENENVVPIHEDDGDNSLVERFKAGDVINISGAGVIAGAGEAYSLDGTYTIAAVSNNSLFLTDPAKVNPAWDYLQKLPEGRSLPLSAVLAATGENWVGPFILEDTERTGVWANLAAMNGLYKDNGRRQYAVDVTVRFEITPIDIFNEPLGEAQGFEFTLKGSTMNRGSIGLTARMKTAFKGRCRIRARRLTPTDTKFAGSVMDEVQFKDLYAMSALPSDNFGDVTIVRAKTVATSGALAVKERKLNCLVTRQIRKRLASGAARELPGSVTLDGKALPALSALSGVFTEELLSSNNVADIFCHLSLDPYIGNRSLAELDLDNIYGTVAEVEEYFGTPLLTEFCYTLDDSNLSYEETAGMVAGVSFCTPYRMGSIIRLAFEKETDLSTMLFNHRNKIPNTETRTVSFGYSNDNDGVRYEYVSPEDDAVVALHLPEDKSAVNPARIESVGVRNRVQAHIHAWRTWNKMKYQSVSLQFKSTYEADLLLRGERILVADNIAGQALDGEVEDQQGLEIFTSRQLNLEPGREYVCFFQLSDRTTQAIPALAGTSARSFVLRYPPNIPLVYDDGKYAKTTFMLACGGESRAPGSAFIVTEKKAQQELTVELEAVNYDARYYMRDADFKREIVREL